MAVIDIKMIIMKIIMILRTVVAAGNGIVVLMVIIMILIYMYISTYVLMYIRFIYVRILHVYAYNVLTASVHTNKENACPQAENKH